MFDRIAKLAPTHTQAFAATKNLPVSLNPHATFESVDKIIL
jgi:hypothetical protein